MKLSTLLCFIIPRLVQWFDTVLIIVPPFIDAFTPGHIVALQPNKNFLSCKEGGHCGDIGHDFVYECLCLHGTENSDSVCCTEKIICLVDLICKKCMIFIVWHCLSSVDLNFIFDVLFIVGISFGRWLCEYNANIWKFWPSSSIEWSVKNEPTSELCITHTSIPHTQLQWYWSRKNH